VEFESPHPAAASPRALAHELVVTEDRPHRLGRARAVAARCKQGRSRRPCHPAVARVEIARKVAEAISHMLTNQAPFHPARPHASPLAA
jgi:hypothetical protein